MGLARTTAAWEAEVGRQVRQLRLRQDLTQAALARRANVSVSSLQSLEHGHGSSLSTVIGVVRALGRDDWLEGLAPEAPISPMALLEQATTRERQRASGRRRPVPR